MIFPRNDEEEDKEVVAILPTGFEESLIYQPCATAKEMQICKC